MPASPSVTVAAPHHRAVDAAREVVASGGGTVDAALAAAMALTVLYPHQCSVGGDLFALVRSSDGHVTCVDAGGRYGSGGLPPAGPAPVVGPFSVTVPGLVSGWAEIHGLGARLPVADLLAPAVRMAADGVAVTERLAAAIRSLDLDGPPHSGGLRRLVSDDTGHRLQAGTLMRQEQLAGTLRALADEGLRSFYDGPVGGRVAASLARLGVPVTPQDLHDHRPFVGDALTVQAAGCRLSTAPPPSQGYLFLSTMLAVDRLAERGVQVDHRALLELFVLTGERRDAELADPVHMRVDAEELLHARQVEVDVDRVVERLGRSAGPSVQSLAGTAGGDTVAVTAVGDDGTAVSLIQSLFHYFGSRLHDPDTGITFHNRAAGFSDGAGSPNSLAAGKRPAHTLMPVLVEHSDGRVSAHGAMGGRAQPQIHTQVLLNRLRGATAAEAVSAPRFVVVPGEELGAPSVRAEPGLGEIALETLAAAGLPLHRGTHLDEQVGHAMVCSRGPAGDLDAGADPRSDGATWEGPSAR